MKIGFGRGDITPRGGKVSLCGQYHLRVTETVLDPLMAYAMVIESEDERTVFVAADTLQPYAFWTTYLCEALQTVLPGLKEDQLIISATHIHTGPGPRLKMTGEEREPDGVISLESCFRIAMDGAIESFTIHDKLYTTTGDICYNNLGQTFCFLFNKTLFDEASLAYPYQSVLEGTWTWDEWERILEVCDSDLDGNGVMDPSVDRFGYMTHIWSGLINMQFAAGLSIVSVVDGEPEISFMSEKTVEVYDRYFSHILPKVNIEVDEGGAFRSGRVFFMDGSMNSAIGFRDMDDDFGIIPFPKYAEDMEYRNAVEGGTNLFLVPITVKDLNASSIILEGMASESWRHLTPEFYEVVLKTKHVRDPESAEILDIIRRSRVFDFGYYNMTIGLDSIPVNLYQTYGNAENLVSFYQKKDKVARKSLEKLMQSYEKIAEAQQEMLP